GLHSIGGALAGLRTIGGALAGLRAIGGALAGLRTIGGALPGLRTIGRALAGLRTIGRALAGLRTIGRALAGLRTIGGALARCLWGKGEPLSAGKGVAVGLLQALDGQGIWWVSALSQIIYGVSFWQWRGARQEEGVLPQRSVTGCGSVSGTGIQDSTCLPALPTVPLAISP
ncbi:hypothetical protein CYMTET_35934, partial [Cymbomonas tetramitiformis]